MTDIEKAIEYLKEPIGKPLEVHYKAIKLAISALEKQMALEDVYITLEEVIARNIIAWETSKDKRDGLLPEIYLTNLFLFRKLTGLEPTMPNLKKVGGLDWSVEE